MWRRIGFNSIKNRPEVRLFWRSFSEDSSRSDWVLNHDIIRNAISSKNQKTFKTEELKQGARRSKERNDNSGISRIKGHIGIDRRHDSHRKKSVIIKWTTGSDRDRAAANVVLQKVLKMNCHGTIRIINPDTKKIEESNIRSFAKGVDLNELGFSIADVEQVNENMQIPLIKMVERRVALKRYSDDLAKRKQTELINMGVMKKAPQKNNEPEKSEDITKQVKMSWQIKLDDLVKQKAHEITRQLKRGYKVHLYLDDKNSINSKNWANLFEDSRFKKNDTGVLSAKELSCRENILEKINEIIEEYSIQPIQDGGIESRMIIKLAPKPSLCEIKDKEKRELKEQRKKDRQEKLQKRVEKKIHKKNEKSL